VKLREAYQPFVQAIVPLLFEMEEVDREIRLVNLAAPHKALNAGGYLLQSVEYAARGSSADKLAHLQITKHLRLSNWEGAELPLWPPYRPPDASAYTPTLFGDHRLYSAEWEEVWKEQAQARAARSASEA
jgi:hypothetical protein